MKNMTKKQKLIVGIVGGILAVALIVTLILVTVKSDTEDYVYVDRDNISVTIDTSVSITLKLNNEYAVTSASPLVSGDEKYAKGLAGKAPFTASFTQLMTRLEEDGKIDGTEQEVILITIESIKHEDYEKVLKIINGVIADKGYNSKVITLYIRAKENKIVEFAVKHDISYGKAYFCHKIANESNKLKADELATKKLSEIYRLAKEDKSESHVDSVVSDLNTSQEEIEVPKEESSKPSSKPSSQKPTSSEDTSADTSSDTTTSSEDTSTPESSTPESTPSTDASSSGQSFGSDSGGSGWISGWY